MYKNMKLLSKVFTGVLIFLSASVHAVPITITGQGTSDGVWDVTTYLCDRTMADCQDTLMAQEWYGDGALARVFAEETGVTLGYVNDPAWPAQTLTPFFNHEQSADSFLGWAYADVGILQDWSGGGDVQYWAVAARAPVAAPPAVVLFGLGLAAIGIKRRFKLRRKI